MPGDELRQPQGARFFRLYKNWENRSCRGKTQEELEAKLENNRRKARRRKKARRKVKQLEKRLGTNWMVEELQKINEGLNAIHKRLDILERNAVHDAMEREGEARWERMIGKKNFGGIWSEYLPKLERIPQDGD